MNRKILIIVTLVTLCQNSQALRIRFSGEAARSLYICDMKAELDCWYALGSSYCELEIERPMGFIGSRPLAVHGFAAEKINEITRDCSDEDKITPYYYGRQGIGCYPDQKLEYHCILKIDHSWIKEGKPAAKTTSKLCEDKKNKHQNLKGIAKKKDGLR